MYKWAVKTLNQLNKSSPLFHYLSTCSTYFVREYQPEKTPELRKVLQKGMNN